MRENNVRSTKGESCYIYLPGRTLLRRIIIAHQTKILCGLGIHLHNLLEQAAQSNLGLQSQKIDQHVKYEAHKSLKQL